ncbi:glycosyltransferase family 25 protein [Mesorhizobium sp.]|uniref:glycosyltransferase family 25 protein n=1 Tax=Mesorhizobium sp. TaxID=1871066 RepID=UPI0025FAFFE9|nr:glycosyltransferase family 25 protein [Mesorhizobium sp.]
MLAVAIMKCYAINLDQSEDRLAHIIAEFARIGAPFDRVAAIEASSVVPAPNLSHAETACFDSHRLCWQMIADGDDPYASIFEDDIIFSESARSLLTNDRWIPADADIVKLETFFTPVRMDRRRTAIDDGLSVARMLGQHIGTAGYTLSRRAARNLLGWTKQIRGPVDFTIFSPLHMPCARSTVYQLTPAICAQSQFVSETPFKTLIQYERPHRRTPLLEKLQHETSRAVAFFRSMTLRETEKVAVIFCPVRRLGLRNDSRP